MAHPRRYVELAAATARDLRGWHRGRPSTGETYIAMRRAHRLTAGWSSVAARRLLAKAPGSPDRLSPLDRPRLDEAGARSLTDLRRDGVAMLEPVLAPDEVASLVDFAERAPARGRLASGAMQPGTYRDLAGDASAVFLDGTFAWARPEVQRILADDRLWDLARAYFGLVPVVQPPQIYWSCAAAPEDETLAPNLARNFHWDYDGVGGLRLHLYLTDVDASAAPMQYVVGSHRPGALRTHELRHADDGTASESALDALGLVERRSITGPAGTTFISDSTGLHRATRPTGRDRLFLVFSLRAGSFAGYYHRRRRVPARDPRFAAALAAGRPELSLFAAADPDEKVVTLDEEATLAAATAG
ncbi:MAG: phytanoyl-CoA dioxygenase family protein [Acidimicrobiales bacterium]